MGRIVVNKHYDLKSEITSDSIMNNGEIVVSNQVNNEGIAIKNTEGNIVFIGTNSEDKHYFLSTKEYEELIKNGSVVVNGEKIEYDDNAYYALYDFEE
jgi:DNA/RNA endonuclease YhcR with UshA esterase domain